MPTTPASEQQSLLKNRYTAPNQLPLNNNCKEFQTVKSQNNLDKEEEPV